MTFDYSITKLKRIKCSNPECSHVYKVYDRKEPVINNPGCVVKECPKCKQKTRFRVWNVDYFAHTQGIVGVYEFDEESHSPELSTVQLGECLIEEVDTTYHEQSTLDLTPKKSFLSVIGEDNAISELKEKTEKQIDAELYWPLQAYLGSKLCMNGVEGLFVKVKKRKNASHDYSLFAKKLSNERAFNSNNMFLIQLGKVELKKQIDGLYTRDECLSILDFCLKRWALAAEQVIIAVPFIGFQYKNKKCKNQVLYYWAFLNSVLDMEKTALLTRKAEFNRLKQYLNELKDDETYDYKKYWGTLDQLQAAADEAGGKKKRGKTGNSEEQKQQQVYFTNKFHSKFYAGIYADKVEVLLGSYNVHEGDVLENLSFKEYTVSEFQKRYLDKIQKGVQLLHDNDSGGRILYYTVYGEEVKGSVQVLDDVIKKEF